MLSQAAAVAEHESVDTTHVGIGAILVQPPVKPIVSVEAIVVHPPPTVEESILIFCCVFV